MQKIPEWYDSYLNYGELKDKITAFKKCTKAKQRVKLHTFYMLTLKSHEIVALCQPDSIYELKAHMNEEELHMATEKAHLGIVNKGDNFTSNE